MIIRTSFSRKQKIFSRIGAVFALLYSITPAVLSAQAFGIDMGASLSDLSGAEYAGNGTYFINAPRPHSEFESYIVTLTETTGVCMIKGIGRYHSNDRRGESVRRAFKSLEHILNENYGAGDHIDWLRPEALWDGSNEWVMALRQNDRIFVTEWKEELGAELPGEISSIGMFVAATGPGTSFIILQYQFSNFEECDREIKAQDASGL